MAQDQNTPLAAQTEQTPVYTNIPEDIAKRMPSDAQDYFGAKEKEMRDWEQNLAKGLKGIEERFKSGEIDRQEYEREKASDAFAHANMSKEKDKLAREEGDYVDMVQRTDKAADRNGLPRPAVHWDFGDGAVGGKDSKGNPAVEYDNNLVRALTPAERDFLAGHELGHTTKENQDLLLKDRRQAEVNADEFAARQPGFDPAVARSALEKNVKLEGLPLTGDADHPSIDDRVRNMERVKRDHDAHPDVPAVKPPEKEKAHAENTTGLPGTLLAQLDKISATLGEWKQEATAVEHSPTVAMISPVNAVSQVQGLNA